MAAAALAKPMAAAACYGSAGVGDAVRAAVDRVPGKGKDEDCEQGGKSRGRFPWEPYKDRFPYLQASLPSTWTKVQSWPHLVLIIGAVLTMGLCLDTAWIWWKKDHCRTRICIHELVPLIFALLSVVYFMETIKQYDDCMMTKQDHMMQAMDEANNQNMALLSDLESHVDKSMGTQANLAEHSFDGSSRDFQRFLAGQKRRLAKAEERADEELCMAFNEFIYIWLDIYAECSVDPVSKPRRVTTPEEVHACGSTARVAAHVAQRLLDCKVKLISAKIEADRNKISMLKQSWNTVSASYAKTARQRERFSSNVDLENGEGEDSYENSHWVRWGGAGVSVTEDSMYGGFPIEISMICVTVVLLSVEHVQLILSFFMGLAIAVWEWFDEEEGFKKDLITQVLVCCTCILFVLWDFLNIDVVQQLEGQLREAVAAKQAVEVRRERMMKFYGDVQRMTDFWLYRTIPRLEIMKQFHDEVRDMSDDKKFTATLRDMNAGMKQIMESDAPLALWVDEEASTPEMKRKLGALVLELTRCKGIKETLEKIPEVAANLVKERELLVAATAEAALQSLNYGGGNDDDDNEDESW